MADPRPADPVPEHQGTPEQQVAYLLWQVNEGYLTAQDRAIGENWFLSPEGSRHPDTEAERPHWLALAREVIAIVKADLSGSHGSTQSHHPQEDQ